MPNWCYNKLTVEHNDPAMLDRFVQAYNKGTVCNEFVPQPKNVDDDWYTWRLDHWGTKWDVGADMGTDHEQHYGLIATVVGNQANCSFDSAWSPPIGLYNKLVDLGYKVHASYFEGGMCFCGVYNDGYNNHIPYKSKNDIPVGVWNDFNLDEFFSDEIEV